MTVGLQEAEELVQEADPSIVDPDLSQMVIHLVSPSVQPNSGLVDDEFNLAFGKALMVRRRSEYCQWQEHWVDETYEDSNGDKHTTRSYYYTKGWISSPINSLLFNQPFAHHNPLRTPFNDYKRIVPSARAGPYTLYPSLIENLNTFKPIFFNPNSLQDGFTSSFAALKHGFQYVGQQYFYNPYQASSTEKTLNLLGQFAEGSILDFQIGDLFSQCTAGDVRMWFEAVEPSGAISIIAKQEDSIGSLGQYRTTNGFQVGLVQEGIIPAKKMFEKALSDYQWTVWGMRFLLFLWAVGVVHFTCAFPTVSQIVFSALCLSGFLLAILNFFFVGVINYYSILLSIYPLILFSIRLVLKIN